VRKLARQIVRGTKLILHDTFQFKSIQFIIAASFTLITFLVVLLISVILFDKFTNLAEQNAYLNNQQIIDQVDFNLEYYLKEMTGIFGQVNDKIVNSDSLTNPKLIEQLDTIVNSRGDIVSLALFTKKGELLTDIPAVEMKKYTNVTEQDWFKQALENPNVLSISAPHIQNLFKGQYKWVVSMSEGVTLNKKHPGLDGVLLIDANFKTIDDLCQRVSLGKKGYVYIIDSAGNIIYHPQQQLIYAGLKQENTRLAVAHSFGTYLDDSSPEKRFITVKTVNDVGWKVVGVSYMDEIVATKKEIGEFIVWLLLLVILFVLLISAFVSAKISQPIKQLEKSMERVEKGDFDIQIQVHGDYEVERLSRRFNLMVTRIRQLMDQIIREQEAKRKSELEVLQAQINPHFLYNTLNSVIRLVGVGKNEDVITTITSLSKLFRISLSRGKTIITVQEELEHVRNYLIIQTIRFKNKFRFEIEAEEDALPCKTLKLILQPIVENAIYHGIEGMVDEGFIKVSAHVIGDKLLFQVRDNGLGIPADVIPDILAGRVKSEGGSGVGLKNVQERIRLFYGEEYGLEMESELEEGTTVRIWIPFQKDDMQEVEYA
jgi:two-component system sensor histidine kinase YesM